MTLTCVYISLRCLLTNSFFHFMHILSRRNLKVQKNELNLNCFSVESVFLLGRLQLSGFQYNKLSSKLGQKILSMSLTICERICSIQVLLQHSDVVANFKFKLKSGKKSELNKNKTPGYHQYILRAPTSFLVPFRKTKTYFLEKNFIKLLIFRNSKSFRFLQSLNIDGEKTF